MSDPMRDFYLPRRIVVRVFRRPNWLWPYWSGRYTIATFGAAYWGIMVMRAMTRAEYAAFRCPVSDQMGRGPTDPSHQET